MKFKTLLLLLIGFMTYGQRKYDTVIQNKGIIKEMVQNDYTGIIAIREGSNIKGIHPDTKEIVWEITGRDIGTFSGVDFSLNYEFKQFVNRKNEFRSHNNSPYIEYASNGQYQIINTETGKIVYNSNKELYHVFQSELIPETNEYILTIEENRRFSIVLIDLKTGITKWETPIKEFNFKSFDITQAGMTNVAKVNLNNIYYLQYGIIYCLDKKNGDLKWHSIEKYTDLFLTQNDKNIVVINNKGILGSTQNLDVLNAATGESIWEESIKTKKIISIEDWGNKLLVAHFSGFNFYDLNTGEKIWKKNATGTNLQRILPLGEDILYVVHGEMMLLDKNGNKLWKSSVSITNDLEDPIYQLEKVGDNILFVTSSFANIVDFKTGKKIWDSNVKFKELKPLLSTHDYVTNSILVFNDEKLYEFNKLTLSKPEPKAIIKLKNEKEVNGLDLFNWGIAVSGPDEMVGFDLDGKIKYHNFYTQPGEANRKLLLAATIIGGIALENQSSKAYQEAETIEMLYRNESGEIARYGNQLSNNKRVEAEVYGTGAAALTQIADKNTHRFNAMKQNKEFAYIFSKGIGKEKMLIKVRKNDGVEVDKILLMNDNPKYEIDPITQDIFYIYNNELQIFNAKN
ncbi:MAG: PQQ-binding-like beta-propeller repeat protein [Pseudarcicella sp.]|nr:PQQ-binding-like beta-propeller repeat protein [Pseudarcicella sp.]